MSYPDDPPTLLNPTYQPLPTMTAEPYIPKIVSTHIPRDNAPIAPDVLSQDRIDVITALQTHQQELADVRAHYERLRDVPGVTARNRNNANESIDILSRAIQTVNAIVAIVYIMDEQILAPAAEKLRTSNFPHWDLKALILSWANQAQAVFHYCKY